MKTLVVYYSRSGVTRSAAEAIAKVLGADLEEIVDLTDRRGALGYLRAGRDAALKRPTVIHPPIRQPKDYDLVIIGTPVWAFTMAPAVRTWIGMHKAQISHVALLCTMGGSGDKRTFTHLEQACGHTPVATLSLLEADVCKHAASGAIETFCAACRRGNTP